VEAKAGYIGFFFVNALNRFDAVFEVGKHRFKNIFASGGGSGQDAQIETTRHRVAINVQKILDSKFKELCWLGEDDPVKIQGFERLSIFDYWTLLDKKIAQIKSQRQPRRK
jgi:hypothetical protein